MKTLNSAKNLDEVCFLRCFIMELFPGLGLDIYREKDLFLQNVKYFLY